MRDPSLSSEERKKGGGKARVPPAQKPARTPLFDCAPHLVTTRKKGLILLGKIGHPSGDKKKSSASTSMRSAPNRRRLLATAALAERKNRASVPRPGGRERGEEA